MCDLLIVCLVDLVFEGGFEEKHIDYAVKG